MSGVNCRTCSTSCWGAYRAYGACSAPCGNNGIQTAYRQESPSSRCRAWVWANGCPGSNSVTRACNRHCNNGGSPQRGSCSCPTGYRGTCCETRVSCGNPGAISNGVVSPSGSLHFYGTTVTFACKTGYSLVGGATRTCGANGQWSGSVPTCQLITCRDPGTPANGARTASDGNNYGSTLRFTCNTGYTLQGDAVRRCKESGSWSGTQPSCAQITCPSLRAPANGAVSTPGGSAYNAQATYTCNTGFHLDGIATRTCQVNGQWNGDAPTCQAITCPSLASPSHGRVSLSNRQSYGSVATFSCEVGYRLSASTTRTCQGSGPTGSWSGTQPTCQVTSCPDPGTPAHGSRQGSSLTYGSTVSYVCVTGYALQGASRFQCRANQQWTAARPTCQACPRNAYKSGANTAACSSCPSHSHTTQIASVSQGSCVCDQGYRGPNGGPCVQILCPELPVPPHAVKLSCSNVYNGNCVFGCVDGYIQLRGDDVRTCGYSDGWSGTDIVCSPCKENTYKSPEGMCVSCPPYSHTIGTGNSIEGCICDAGFELLGEPGTACTDVDECDVNNAGCAQTCENNNGGYTCLCTDPGFVRDAEDKHNCVSKNNCPELENPNNGGFVCVSQPRTNTERCQIKCNPGYEHVLQQPNYYEECGPTSNWMWSYAIRNVPILPCELQFFEGFNMEADVFYFVSTCETLTEAEITAAKQEFLQYTIDQNLCQDTGLLQCTIDDVTLECGVEAASDFGRRRRSARMVLRFHFTVAIPETPRAAIECDDICPRNSYCEEDCNVNYQEAAMATLEVAANVIVDIFGEGSIPEVPRPSQGPSDDGDSTESDDDFEDGPVISFGGILMIPDTVQVGTVTTFCESGHTAKNGTCVPCPGGSYFLESTGACDTCPVRTYQPQTGAHECRPCATATKPGMATCPPRRNPFDIIIDTALQVAQEVDRNPVDEILPVEPTDPVPEDS